MSSNSRSLAFRLDGQLAGQSVGAMGWADQGHVTLIGTSPPLPSLDLGALFDDLVNAAGGGAAWPAGFIDVTFADTSMFYAFKAPLPAGVVAQLPAATPTWVAAIAAPGMYLGSSVTLTLFDHTFPPMEVSVGVVRGQGVKIAGELDDSVAVLGGVITLAGVRNGTVQPDAGPTLAVDTTASSPTFALQSAVQFLGESVSATLDVTRSSGATQIAGSLAYPGDVGPFRNPTLALTWSRAAGLAVTGFPGFSPPGIVLDFAQLLRKFIQSKGCSAPSFKGLQQPLTTSFNVQPGVTTTQPSFVSETGLFYVTLGGSYQISVTNGPAVCDVALPSIGFAVQSPGALSFDTLAGQIATAIGNAGEQIFQALWDDKAQLAKFLSVFLGAQLLKSIMNDFAGNFACKLNPESPGGNDDGLGDFESALSAVGGSLLDVGVAIAGGLAAAASALLASICGGGDDNNNNSGGSGGALLLPPIPLPTPAGLTVSVSATGQATLSWNAIPGAYGFVAKFVDPGKNLLKILFAPGTTAVFAVPSPLAAGNYGFLVQAIGTGTITAGSPWSPPFGLSQLPAPTDVALAFAAAAAPGAAQSLTVTAVATAGANAYNVNLVDADSGAAARLLFSWSAPPFKSSNGVITLALSVPASALTAVECVAQVQAVGDTTSSATYLDSGFSAPSPTAKVPRPGIGTMAIGSTFRVG